MIKMTDMYSISVDLRGLAHILRYAGYIHEITDDEDFYQAVIDITSDYLYYLSDDAGKSHEIVDKESCEKSGKIKELQEKIDELSSQIANLLNPESAESDQAEQTEEAEEPDGLLTSE